MKFQQKLILNKAKVHSIRYDAPKAEQNPKVRSLYISKTALDGGTPKEITLTVESK